MLPHMTVIVPHLATNNRVRHLRISVPLVECLVDGVRYFREGDLPPAAGEELRSIARPKIGTRPKPSQRRRPSARDWAEIDQILDMA